MDQSESTAANPVRRSRRRWFQYSLRSFLVLLTALAVWLGIVVHRAREQREAVEAIEALGGDIWYDWRGLSFPAGSMRPVEVGEPSGPQWLRRIVGDDYFQFVQCVNFSVTPPLTEDAIRDSIPQMVRLHGLRAVCLPIDTSSATFMKAKIAVPRSHVYVDPLK